MERVGRGLGGTVVLLALVALLLVSPTGPGNHRGPAVSAAAAPVVGRAGAPDPGASALADARASLVHGGPAALSDAGARPAGAVKPPGPTAVTLTWDAVDGYVLALAPNITGNYTSTIANLSSPSQTWTFLGGVWTQLHPSTAPSSRGFAAMTYDAADGYVLLFGGVPAYGFCAPYAVVNHPGDPFYSCYSDTWSYRAGTWTNLTGSLAASPPPYFDGTSGYQGGPQLVYDALDGYALLYGQNNSETWGYSGGQWLNLTNSAGAAPGVDGTMAYDASDGYVLYFGGLPSGSTGSPFDGSADTWEFAHGHWANVSNPLAIQPSPRSFASLSGDGSTGGLLLFGGIDLMGGVYVNFFESWSYSGGPFGSLGNWLELSGPGGPSPRFHAQLVFDPTDGESVLFGGAAASSLTDSVTAYRDSWILKSGAWTGAGPLIATARTSLDTQTNLTLSVVDLPFDALSTGQFVYSGLPPGCAGANSPVLTCTPETAGTYRVSVSLSSGLGGANATISLTVNPDPAFTGIALSRGSTEPGIPVLVSASVDGGTGPIHYDYQGLPGCPASDAPTFTCDPTTAGTFSIRATATDALGLTTQFAQTLYVVPDLSLSPLKLTPSATDVGLSTVAVVGTSGGVGPFEVAYRGLPAGCASDNTTSLACRPTAPGAFALSVSASDSLGFNVSAHADLLVNPDPSITSFSVSSASVQVGSPVTFQLAISGGTGPFSFSYRGLPWGCDGANASEVACTPSALGTFAVVATATDAVGYTVAQPVTLVVTSGPGPSGPAGGGFAVFGSSFAQGVLAGVVLLAIVGLAGGAWALSDARRTEADRLADELLDRAPELYEDAEDDGGETDEPEPPGPE